MFYLPIYFQSIHGQSVVRSGVNTLPFLALFAVGAVISGAVIGKTRSRLSLAVHRTSIPHWSWAPAPPNSRTSSAGTI
jgi:hypothetical protein